MRRTITLLATTAALAAGITGSASAATLYTTSAHSTPVAVGTQFVAKTVASYYDIYYGPSLVDFCQPIYVFQVAQNSGGVFKANVLSRSFPCGISGWVPGSTGALTISGSSTTVGSNKVWAGTSLTGTLTRSGVTYTESFSGAGVSAQQPSAGGSPVSIVLNNAGTMTAPGMTGTYTVTGTYNVQTTGGVSAPYSLG